MQYIEQKESFFGYFELPIGKIEVVGSSPAK